MELLVPIILFGAIESPDKVVAVQIQVSDKEILGQRPYEMVWTDRIEDHVPLVDFEDLTEWNVALYNGAEAVLQRSREQQMWGQYTGKLEYSGKSQESKLIISPPRQLTSLMPLTLSIFGVMAIIGDGFMIHQLHR